MLQTAHTTFAEIIEFKWQVKMLARMSIGNTTYVTEGGGGH